MKQKCVQCILRLTLIELHWDGSDSTGIVLEGPPVFVRVCALGQLQHSDLHQPAFPVSISQELRFDRVLTNCRNPALFSEVIRGEHVRVELIQVSADYQGGKVLARYEGQLHKFLFPEESADGKGPREIELSKSRKYQHAPRLVFSTSTTLLETIVISPIDSIVKDTTTSNPRPVERKEGTPSLSLPRDSDVSADARFPTRSEGSSGTEQLQCRSSPARNSRVRCSHEHQPTEPPLHSSGIDQSASTRLHSMLSSYSQLPSRKEVSTKLPESFTVEVKPTSPASHRTIPQQVPTEGTTSAHSSTLQHSDSMSHYYRTLPSQVGPHCWHECPRRTTKGGEKIPVSSLSSPDLSQLHRTKPSVIPNNAPIDQLTSSMLSDPVLAPRRTQAPNPRPPFVVRHVDTSLLKKRSFCGECGPCAVRHISKLAMEETLPVGCVQLKDHPPSHEDVSTSYPSSVDRRKDSQSASSQLCHQTVGRQQLPFLVSSPSSGQQIELQSSALSEPSYSHIELSSQQLKGGIDPTSTQQEPPPRPASEAPSLHCRACHQGGDLLSKYLMASHTGNRWRGVASPSQKIEEKLHVMMRECCECQHASDSLGEDSLTEDLDRLRASLAAERNQTLNQSAKVLPNQSVTVKLGPQDYWSQRMSEFTGQSHRDVFGENMERIYSRLYQQAQ